MGLKKKDIEVLKILNSRKITIKKLTSLVFLSERNLRYNLQKIDGYLKEYFFDDGIKKIGKEIYLNYSKNEIKFFLLYIYEKHYVMSKDERKEYILNYFLFNKKPTLAQLEKEIDITRTTLKKDLIDLDKVLKKYDLRFYYEATKIYIGGNEKKIRNFMMINMLNIFDRNEQDEVEKTLGNTKLKSLMINSISLNKLFLIKDLIDSIEKRLESNFSLDFKKMINYYLCITELRITRKKYVLSKHNGNFLSETFQYRVLKEELKKIIPQKLNFEYLHLTEYFLSSSINGEYNDEILSIQLFTYSLLKRIDSRKNQDFEVKVLKKKLFDDICNYLISAFYRVKNNFILGNIKEKELRNKNLIDIITRVSVEDKFLSEKLREEEIYGIEEKIESYIKLEKNKKISLKKLVEIGRNSSTNFGQELYIKKIMESYGEIVINDLKDENPFKLKDFIEKEILNKI